MLRAPRDEGEEREMYGRLAYVIPSAFLGAVFLSSFLGAVFRGRVPPPGYSLYEVVPVVLLLITVASVVCLALSRPPWWHGILWSAMMLWIWAICPVFY